MRRKIGFVVLAFGVLSLLGAGGDTITEKNVTPNPGGAASLVSGSGVYGLGVNNGKQNLFQSVAFYAQNTKTKQITSNNTKAGGGNWSGNLDVVAGNYDCFGVLNTKDANNGTLYITDSNTINVNVK